MYRELKENKPHGTKSYPYTQYHIQKPSKAFHIPVHWHDEVELIYVKKGNVTIFIEEQTFHAGPKGRNCFCHFVKNSFFFQGY